MKGLKDLLKEKGMTQSHIRQALRYPAVTLQKWVAGIESPSDKAVGELAQVIGCSEQEIKELFI